MKKTIIIAEAGVNHNGDMNLARELIDIAADAGADYVKFQSFKAEELASHKADKAEYQKQNDPKQESQQQMLKRLELSYEKQAELKKYCEGKIKFLSSPFDSESALFLNKLGVDFIKIPSGEITNLPYLELIASLDKDVILSTGMSYMKEIEEAVAVLTSKGLSKSKITVLQCNTEYPTPFTDVNLNAMVKIGENLEVGVGYSDHTPGIEAAIAAVALGAKIIEKHFTINKNLDGPDHKASLEPHELKEMAKCIRNIELAMGNFEKKPSLSETKNRDIARKSIIAKTDIKVGDVFSSANLTVKRPGNGISPMKWHEIIGKKAEKNYSKDDLI